jgi:hypothetical protein
MHLNSEIQVIEYREEGTFIEALVRADIASELAQFKI